MSGFYTPDELAALGLQAYGDKVWISRKASIYKPESIRVGHHVRIDDFCTLSGGTGLSIGNYVHVGAYSAIFAGAGVAVEDYAGLSPRCTVFSETDDFSGASLVQPFFPREYKPGYQSAPVILRRFAQLGAGSTVLPGVELGEGAAVGAHSLVLRGCDAWSIYAGVPVRRMGDRKRDVLALIDRFHREHPAD